MGLRRRRLVDIPSTTAQLEISRVDPCFKGGEIGNGKHGGESWKGGGEGKKSEIAMY
jgi:hypothetical protein